MRFVREVPLILARLTRRLLKGAARNTTLGLYLNEAGFNVDRLLDEG